MKTFNGILFACALFMCSLSVFADDARKVYEFNIIDFNRLINVEEVNRELNDWGKEGWFIVSTERVTLSGTHTFIRVFMQREVQESK